MYNRPEYGIRIALPPQWKSIDIDQEHIDASVQNLRDANPDFHWITHDRVSRTLSSDGIFIGISRSNEARAEGCAPGILIWRRNANPGLSLDLFVQMNMGQVETLEGIEQPIQHRRVRLNAGEAEEMTIRIKLALKGRSELLDCTQIHYYLVTNEAVYVIVLGTPSKWLDGSQSIFQTMIQSFEFTE